MVESRVDPELVALVEALPIADFDDAVVRATREVTTDLFASLPLSDEVEHTDHVVDETHGVLVRTHRRKGATATLPCLVWIHGGGFVIGSHLMDGPALDRLAATHGVVVASVEYRLAPETPYPGALEDCDAAMCWIADNAHDLGVDPTRTGIGGQSAGGGLAAALALHARDRRGFTPAFVLLDAPMLDDRAESDSIRRDDLVVWSRASNRYGWEAYLGDLAGADEVPGTAAPARASDLTGLPPTLLIVGGADGLCDEGVAYAARLMAAGTPTDLHVVTGAVHGVTMFPGTRVVDRWQRIVDDWLAGQIR